MVDELEGRRRKTDREATCATARKKEKKNKQQTKCQRHATSTTDNQKRATKHICIE